jgi:hypothetical protein
MSRTYRRTGDKNRHESRWALSEWEWIDLPDGSRFMSRVRIDPKSDDGRKRIAQFHSDAGHYWMQWRGPSWFHREYSQAPYRARCKQAIKRFFKNQDDEPVLESKPGREYWL